MATVIDRARVRLDGEPVTEPLLEDLVQTAEDRIKLRAGVDFSKPLPPALESIAVEVTVKMWRRRYYEGLTSENADAISTSFADDILKEYDAEIEQWKSSGEGTERLVRFI
jgi:hypothetical protein